MNRPSTLIPTLYGVLALIFWGASPAIVCKIRYIPVFQLSMLIQGISFLFTLGVALKKRRLKVLWSELPRSLVLVPLLVMNQICYVYAFRLAPPDQVDLINYLWPIMTVVGGSFLFAEKMAATRLIGILMGFLAILFLGRHDILNAEMGSTFFLGYLAAFGSALSWTLYVLGGQMLKGISAYQHIGFHIGLSSVVMMCLHFGFDPEFRSLDLGDWALVSALGIMVYGLGYPLWCYGIEKGRFALLTSLSYLAPILSIFALIVTNVVEPTWDLALACLMVTGGSWLVNHNQPLFMGAKKRLLNLSIQKP